LGNSVVKIAPFLWFKSGAEVAVEHYVSIFPDSKITDITRYNEAVSAVAGEPVGSVMTVSFELAGQEFMALSGGSSFSFNESVSFMVLCDTQADVDYFWEKLSEGGDPNAQMCGWLKDKFGLSWQVTPTGMLELLRAQDPQRAERASRPC